VDALIFVFVALLFFAAIILTLNVRSQILRSAGRLRDQQEHQEEEHRRRNAQRGNPRSATGR